MLVYQLVFTQHSSIFHFFSTLHRGSAFFFPSQDSIIANVCPFNRTFCLPSFLNEDIKTDAIKSSLSFLPSVGCHVEKGKRGEKNPKRHGLGFWCQVNKNILRINRFSYTVDFFPSCLFLVLCLIHHFFLAFFLTPQFFF